MQKRSKNHSSSHNYDRQQIRLTTAPVRDRQKYPDFSKANHVELPFLRGKKISQPDTKKVTYPRKQDVLKTEAEVEEVNKRPQTSKGSRKTTNADSEYYEEEYDDLLIVNNSHGISFPNNKTDFHKKSGNCSTQINCDYNKL